MKVKLIENDEFNFSSMKTLIQYEFVDHLKILLLLESWFSPD